MDPTRRTERLRVDGVWLIGACALLCLASCRSSPPCPAQARTDASKAISDYARQTSGWTSLKAEARVTQWGAKGRIRGTVLMFLERPDLVRFDVMTQLGPAAILTSDGERFQLADMRENVFMHGPTCPENIQRLLGISMDADNVLRLLTGNTPIIEAQAESMVCEGGNYIVTIKGTDGSTQEIAFAVPDADEDKPSYEQRLELRRSRLESADGDLVWEATYGDYTLVQGFFFPTRVRFVDNQHDSDTSVRIKSIAVNPTIPAGAFQQTPRPGMVDTPSPCVGIGGVPGAKLQEDRGATP